MEKSYPMGTGRYISPNLRAHGKPESTSRSGFVSSSIKNCAPESTVNFGGCTASTLMISWCGQEKAR